MADAQNRISQVILKNNELEFDIFKTTLNEVIQRHALIKQWYVLANQGPFINKKINKEIVKGHHLEINF